MNKAEFCGCLWWIYFREDIKPDGWDMEKSWEKYQLNPDPAEWTELLLVYKQLTSGDGKVPV